MVCHGLLWPKFINYKLFVFYTVLGVNNDKQKVGACEMIGYKSVLDLSEFYSKRQNSANKYKERYLQFTRHLTSGKTLFDLANLANLSKPELTWD